MFYSRLISVGRFVLVVVSALTCLGCLDRDSADFKLPVGNAKAGKVNFMDLGCTSCHEVSEHPMERPYAHESIYVLLGGPSTKVKTYTELVTSIINPSHKLSRGFDPRTVKPTGESRMPNYNEVMQVQQLIDIVAFLQPTYQLYVPPNRMGASTAPLADRKFVAGGETFLGVGYENVVSN